MFRIFSRVVLPLLFLFLSLSLSHSFPSRSSADSAMVITANKNAHVTRSSTWQDLTRLRDVKKGSHVSGISDLKRYLHRFGYLTHGGSESFTDVFDPDLETAISFYQKNHRLPVTGKLDSATVTLIASPRCGVSDSHANTTAAGFHATRRYAFFDGKPLWVRKGPVNLTYAFSKTNTVGIINVNDIKAAFGRAFSHWAAVVPVSFAEIDDYDKANIKIGFYHGDHGDGHPFDGLLGILAHATAPEAGWLHLDAAETWAVDFRTTKSSRAIDLESVATHEIGHTLGLAHSTVPEAVMFPSLSPRTKKTGLSADDVVGIQALYGSKQNSSSSLPSDTEDSWENGVVRRSGSVILALLGLALFW